MQIRPGEKQIKLRILGRTRICYYTGNINKPWWLFFAPGAIVRTAEGDITYIGEIKDNKITGKGKMIFKNGNVYEGNFLDGNLNGKGKRTWANGNVEEGNFVDGYLNGKGKRTGADGDVYEGNFVDGNLKGKGKVTRANGNVYEGNFVNSNLNGKGKRTYTNGAILKGNYKNGIYTEDKEIRERHNELCIVLVAAHDHDNEDKQQYQSLKKYEETINAKYNYKDSDNLGILVKHDEISGDYNNELIDRDLLKNKIKKIKEAIDKKIAENKNGQFKVLKIHIDEHGGEDQTYEKEITPFVEEVLKIAKEKGIKNILITNDSCHGATKDETTGQSLENVCASVFKDEKYVNIFIKKNEEKDVNYLGVKQYKNQKDNISFLKNIWANGKAVIEKFNSFASKFKKSNKKNIHKMYDKVRKEIKNEQFLLDLNSIIKNNRITRW